MQNVVSCPHDVGCCSIFCTVWSGVCHPVEGAALWTGHHCPGGGAGVLLGRLSLPAPGEIQLHLLGEGGGEVYLIVLRVSSESVCVE